MNRELTPVLHIEEICPISEIAHTRSMNVLSSCQSDSYISGSTSEVGLSNNRIDNTSTFINEITKLSGSILESESSSHRNISHSSFPHYSRSHLSILQPSTSTTAQDHHENISREQIHEDENKTVIFLSVITIGSMMGAAYYDTDSRILFIMPDIVDQNDLKVLKQLIAYVTPDVVITNSKQKDNVLQYLKQLESEDEEGESNLANIHSIKRLELLPNQMFARDLCKRRIHGLNGLPNLSDDATDEERLIYFSSFINEDSTSMISATGALLKYLDQARPGMELEDVGLQVPVLFIKAFSLHDLMVVDGYTYSSLQIFQKESHPSVYKAGGSKEGLSLFGIMNHTKSLPGSSMLKHWFLQPTVNKECLTQRLNAIEYFLSPRNIEVMVALQDALKNIKNILRILSKMKSAGVSLVDWSNLYKTIFNAICVGDICRGVPQNIYIVNKIATVFSKDLLHIADLIKKIVDFEESSYANHFVVREGIDDDLDTKKKTFDGIPFLMTKIAQEELSKLNRSIMKCSVTYFPQLGYHLNIPITEEMKETGCYDIDEHLEFKFTAEDVVYYKSERTLELDQRVGDIQCDIRDHEMAIMHRLQNIILERSECLHDVIKLAAELDCILALTSAARENNFTRPTLFDSPEDFIKIKGGRHPLQELCVTQFVKNDTNVGGNRGKIKILTGPNASGKSVYIKQTGLIVFLCHIGSFVPCDSCEISLKDAIYTRVHSVETVSLPLSTFMIDLNQISNAVTNATKNSCVIIDEFGKGTSAVDGLALLCATLKYWVDRGHTCPNILLSTHFHQIRQFLQASELVNYQTMEVMRADDDDLIFLYRVKEGFGDHSHASHTAKLASIPQEIITRAEQVSRCVRENEPLTKPLSSVQANQTQSYEKIVDEFLNKDLDAVDVTEFLKSIVHL